MTYYNFTSNQFSGFHGIVIPGTLHDSPYVLDGLMENQSSLEPKQLMTDTAGYSDIVFALFWLLGFPFSPRLADIGESRFWRLDRPVDYGALNSLASHRLNPKLIARAWAKLSRAWETIASGVEPPSGATTGLAAWPSDTAR